MVIVPAALIPATCESVIAPVISVTPVAITVVTGIEPTAKIV